MIKMGPLISLRGKYGILRVLHILLKVRCKNCNFFFPPQPDRVLTDVFDESEQEHFSGLDEILLRTSVSRA